MITNNFNPKSALLVTRFIFFGIFLASLAVLIIALFFRPGKYFFQMETRNFLTISPLIICLILIPSAIMFSKRLLGKIDTGSPLTKKFRTYQIVMIIRISACECTILFSAIIIFLTGNLLGIIIPILALVIMLIYFPTVKNVSSDLNITQQEIEQFY
jgi:hypothetical protein